MRQLVFKIRGLNRRYGKGVGANGPSLDPPSIYYACAILMITVISSTTTPKKSIHVG